MKSSKVMVSGCFDVLHSGHIAFLENAAKYGELHVCLGSDRNVLQLKNRATYFNESERAYMLRALRCVHQVYVNKGMGKLDFIEEINNYKPDIFIVNEDGHSAEKERFIKELGIEYVVLKRNPAEGLPARSTTAFRNALSIPFRIDLAGGWLDQPFVNKIYPGSVITISIQPTIEFNNRSGMASSTRNSAIELWNNQIPSGDWERNAKILFAVDNPPGKPHVSGSQDSIGIVFPGLNKLHYNDSYWPESIDSVLSPDVLDWIEQHLFLIPIAPRESSFNVLDEMNIEVDAIAQLADAANTLWEAVLKKDLLEMGKAMTLSFKAQCALFPLMTNEYAESILEPFRNRILGYKISGAGGGGYWIVISEKPADTFLKIKIRQA